MLRNEDRERLNEGVVATSLDPVENESDHFYTCPRCGQAVDMPRLCDVFHHDDKEHEPIPAN